MASRRRRHTPEQIIRKLREGEKQLGQGKHSAGVGEWVVWWQCVTTGLVRPVVSGVGTRG
jgi:hypothetical protein